MFCGNSHIFLRYRDGTVVASGRNDKGQLLVADEARAILFPY